jgi:hypothetical protein
MTQSIEQMILSNEYSTLLRENISARLDGTRQPFTAGTRGTTRLDNLISDYNNGRLLLPPHQREDCWPDLRKRSLLLTVSNDEFPPGCFEMYRLLLENGKKSALYLNDGAQRLFAALDILNNPDKYSLRLDDVQYLFENTSYPHTEKLHLSHQDALLRFQAVNNNLQLTNYQKIIGELIYCRGDENHAYWQAFIDSLHKVIFDTSAPIVSKLYPNPKGSLYIRELHMQKRHDLSLFYRFLKKDKAPRDYKPGSDVILEKLRLKKPYYFEQKLITLLKPLTQAQVSEKFDKFARILQLETALFEQIWDDVREEKGTWLGGSCYRWLLDVMFWRRNNNCKVPVWEDFVRKFLAYGQGQTNLLFMRDGEPARMNVSVGRPKTAERVCWVVEADLMPRVKPSKPRRRKTTKGEKRPGWHNSHYEPQVTHGDGPTFPEAGISNMSRGAKPVE